MHISIEKTTNAARKGNPQRDFLIKVENKIIQRRRSTRNLGITIDEKKNFHDQVEGKDAREQRPPCRRYSSMWQPVKLRERVEKLKQMATKMEYCNQTEKTLRISTRRDETTPKLHPPTLLNEWKIPEHVVLHSSITKDLVSRERAILVGTDVKDIINDRLLQSVLDITLQQ